MATTLSEAKVLILLELALFFDFFYVRKLHFNTNLHLCARRVFSECCMEFELVAIRVRGKALPESIIHTGRCKPPEHSEQINASSPRQKRLLTYIYLSAANRLSLKMLNMCDERQHGAIFQAGRRVKVQVTREFWHSRNINQIRRLSESNLSQLFTLLYTLWLQCYAIHVELLNWFSQFKFGWWKQQRIPPILLGHLAHNPGTIQQL